MILTLLILEEWSGYWTVKQVALDSLKRLKDENQVLSNVRSYRYYKFGVGLLVIARRGFGDSTDEEKFITTSFLVKLTPKKNEKQFSDTSSVITVLVLRGDRC